ncbi:MAG: FAD-dependent oxidoreductase [Fibrobacteria bacterium]|nr:FAD-dependent oxidoreductase [Fibrobacteria bacterium]
MPIRPHLAVVGAGVAGISAAWKLRDLARVTLFENQDRLGGHTHTVTIPDGPDAGIGVDTGFIVLNDRTYPNLHDLLRELDVPVRWSDMSFGYHDETTGLQYSGRGWKGLLADPKNALNPRMWSLIRDFLRFNRRGRTDLLDGANPDITLGRYLRDGGFSQPFIDHYLVPMGAAIWSTSNEEMLEFPLQVFLEFFLNHGLLSVKDRPRWQTVQGGSHAYVQRFRERFEGTIVESAQVEAIRRLGDGVEIHRTGREPQKFDGVILAVHADQVLGLLLDPSEEERRLFGAWRYQENHTVLHHDTRVLPDRELARASWNFTREDVEALHHPVSVTYDMKRLQGLSSRNHWLVTLNRTGRIDPTKVVREITYHHPTFTLEAIKARKGILDLNGLRRTWYTGSYFGFGFHEDAVRSSVELVARHFGGNP